MIARATLSDYDWRIDSYLSWELAIAELRKRGLRDGRFHPVDDEERAYVEAHRMVSEGGV